jgi:arylsulfatase A-like enzyme
MQNILIYVADGLPWHYLPNSIAEQGPCFKTVASSLYSPPSFATLLTGLYPQQHGVHNWKNRLSDEVGRVIDIDGIEGGYIQAGDSRLSETLRVEKQIKLSDLDPPFVAVERDLTTHYPYTQSDNGDYFTKDWEIIRTEYRKSINRSIKLFEKQLDHLAERGILDETLVIFTSDHGELLGERGEALHVAPACPELVYVPTVFIHPNLSEQSFCVDPSEEVIEHVDITRTAVSLLDDADMDTMGTNITEYERDRDWGYNHADVKRNRLSFYRSDSIWWHDGGIAVMKNSKAGRLMYYLYKLTRSISRSKHRQAPVKTLLNYIYTEYVYNSPPASTPEARDTLEQFVTSLGNTEAMTVSLDDETREQLREMGYLT